MPTPFAIYPIIEVPHFTDGDTLWVRREWHTGYVDRVELVARDDRAGVCVRLTDGLNGLNTPDKKNDPDGHRKASRELREWVEAWSPDELELHVYEEKPDSFGRRLGDLVPRSSASGLSAVGYMRNVKGYPAWKK